MTKRDYETLAGALHAGQPATREPGWTKLWDVWLLTVEYVADALAQDSPRFDRERFVAACERGGGV